MLIGLFIFLLVNNYFEFIRNFFQPIFQIRKNGGSGGSGGNVHEPFYVFFKPFQKIDNMNRYNEIDYFTRNTDYQNYIEMKYTKMPINIYFYYNFQDKTFLQNFQYFFKKVVANSNLLQMNFKLLSNSANNALINSSISSNPLLKIANRVNNEKYTMALLDSAELFYSSSNNIYHPFADKTNIQIVSGIYYNYLYIITKKTNGIQTLGDLYGKRFGIFYESLSRDYIIPHRIVEYFGKDFNKSVKFVSGTYKENWQRLKDGSIDAMFISSYYPNQLLNSIFNNPFHKDYIMVPIEFEDHERFVLENPYLEKTTIDLNFTKQFLPRRINGVYYNQFNPDFPTYKSKVFIVCNRSIEETIPYELVSLLAKQPVSANNLNQYFTDVRTLFLNSSQLPVAYHPGTERYLREKGYINNFDTPLCSYFAGKKNCDETTLRKNQLFQWDFLSSPEPSQNQLPNVEIF